MMIGLRLLIVALVYASGGAGIVDHDEYRNDMRAALAEYGVATDADSLLRAVAEDKRSHVRLMAGDLLSNLREPRTGPLLRSRLADEGDETVRAHFVSDLLELEGNAAHNLALATLRDLKDLIARMWVARALAEAGDLSGYPDILTGLHSKSSLFHSLAAQDLAAFVKACDACDLKPQPLDVALGLLENASVGVRLSALIAVQARLGDDPRCAAALDKVGSTDQNQSVRETAATFMKLWRLKKRDGTGGSL